MFCNHCGARNPDGSTFCSSCGREVGVVADPAAPAAPAEQRPAPSPPPTATPLPASPQRTGRFRLWAGATLRVVSGLTFSYMHALRFHRLGESLVSAEMLGTWSAPVILSILIGWFGFARKKDWRGFTWAIFLTPLALMTIPNRAAEEAKALRKDQDAWFESGKGLGERNAAVRARFSALHLENVKTMDEYLQRCDALGTILVEYQKLAAESKRFFAEERRLFGYRRDMIAMADAAEAAKAKDEEVMGLFGQEVQHASAMRAIPSSERAAYYQRYIAPLKEREQTLLAEEMRLMKLAEDKGIKWP